MYPIQNALRHKAKLLYCAFDLMFADGEDLRALPLLERKKRLKAVPPRHKLIAFSNHRKGKGTEFFAEAERRHLEGIMAKNSKLSFPSPSDGRSGERFSGRRRSCRGGARGSNTPPSDETIC